MSSSRNGFQKKNRFRKFNNRRDRPREERPCQSYNNVVQDRCKQFLSQEKLTEAEAGISEYVSEVPGFSGVIKARFSDFHVNEIEPNGNVTKLTVTSPPADFFHVEAENEEPDLSKPDVIPDDKWDQVNAMMNDSSEETRLVEIDVTDMGKEDRTKIHEGVKRVFGKKIVASTKKVDDKKIIELRKHNKSEPQEKRSRWPKDKGEFVHFVLYKEAIDTMEACFKISHCLGLRASIFNYAGVKDRRAKTTQWVSVKKVDPARLINKTKHLRNVHIGNITFKDEPLRLGHLSGNRFRIALRNVTANDDVINEALESLKNHGFINYYGLQRFGNDREAPTFEIGVKLLQGNWKEACDLILKPRSLDNINSDIVQATQVYKETSNAELADQKFSRNHNKCVESKLLQGFIKNHKNDYVNALENIPRNMRLLYIHSFQSLVWNNIASRRVKEFRLKPIIGDIVLLNGVESNDNPDTNNDEETSSAQSDKQEIKILTETDLQDYTIYDVALPLPGYDIQYPDNIIKDWYKEILEKYNLSLEMPKQTVKTYTLSGAYRKLIGQAKDLSWKTIKYNHPNDNLIRSDYEELNGDPEPQDNPSGEYKALIIDFSLTSSCYATMVLREVLKTDTSPGVQAKLNNYHKSKEYAETNSLLSDAQKYEDFKKQIFGNSSKEEEPTKRKKTDESTEVMSTKKAKVENQEVSIKMQPSLV